MANLTKAIMLAAQYHEGQTDKGGNPYVFHPLRLMLKAYGETEQIVAVLHDTIEDTELTLPLLREAGFSETIVEAVDALSRRKKESYEDFILRIKDNPLARRVKVYDLQDNMDLTRIKKRTEKDKERLKKYSRALDVLLGGDLPEKETKASKAGKPEKTDKASKPTAAAKAKADPATEPKPEPRAEQKAEPKAEPQAEPQAEPKVAASEQEPAPVTKPKRAPKAKTATTTPKTRTAKPKAAVTKEAEPVSNDVSEPQTGTAADAAPDATPPAGNE